MNNGQLVTRPPLDKTVVIFNRIANGTQFTSLDFLKDRCTMEGFKKYSAEGKKADRSMRMDLIKLERAGYIKKAGSKRDGRNVLIKIDSVTLTADAKDLAPTTPTLQKPTKKDKGQLDALAVGNGMIALIETMKAVVATRDAKIKDLHEEIELYKGENAKLASLVSDQRRLQEKNIELQKIIESKEKKTLNLADFSKFQRIKTGFLKKSMSA